MTAPFSRMGTANSYETALRNLSARQNSLVTLQGQMSANKSVLRGSDDPTAAAAAERATTRLSRIDSEQRALAAQRNTIQNAESTLGSVNSAIQDFRELVVQAGSGVYNATDRASIAQQLTSLRDQILAYANEKDTNGQPLFGGLGSSVAPFVDGSGNVSYDAVAGQNASAGNAISNTIDGKATFMNVPTGNGVFTVDLAKDASGKVTNTGTASTDAGKVTDPSALTGNGYTISFALDAAGKTTYTVTNTTTGTAALTNQPYVAGNAIAFDGISLTVKGNPVVGDTINVGTSTTSNLFKTLDDAISTIGKAGANVGAIGQAVTNALVQLDAGLTRTSASRGYAGELLNRADRISDVQDARTTQVTSDLSVAEGSDQDSQIKRISDFQNQQTGYSAALQSYAQIQKLSLFNFIGG
ncbi:flagellar hook-associated protein FlgL [Xylophilus ampelinus]|uniref:Flagellar hook-associated protein 3 FlgL n=1 Tax=Xylophilus ampelinus TaxID=54067 RepID=A0A318SJ14_9BURK|nr:flagellar hook-associated protein FlgL [Xylophilus ampelinus]MCS4511235.1 flagellar hook-associated protein FlgL [Xylophilus ampelinus]PYE75012.1 flagellar hook-associated protein 3 FlgL [Xylophilus ampelinus]